MEKLVSFDEILSDTSASAAASSRSRFGVF